MWIFELSSDAISGHDSLDSTTVSDGLSPVVISEEPSIDGLTIGIPQVKYGYNNTKLHILEQIFALRRWICKHIINETGKETAKQIFL